MKKERVFKNLLFAGILTMAVCTSCAPAGKKDSPPEDTAAQETEADAVGDDDTKLWFGITDLENEYIKERNAGLMDCGEVQIMSNNTLYEGDSLDQKEIRFIRHMFQYNYKMNDSGQLLFVSSSEDVVLFTHEQGKEKGTYPIRDAQFAEEGDRLLPSVEAMYKKVGMPADELQENIDANRILVLFDLQEYMTEHPEVKGIEYEGEIRTAEELDEIMNTRLEEYDSAK
ncbi:MAG: hypothetical protein IJH93_04460 [Lachnospiraceae bacterium]|nr:hypothetical protein [Sarcina sp.]MBQ6590781.1 hypothetical protein [Lachnospiraceae bacterium]